MTVITVIDNSLCGVFFPVVKLLCSNLHADTQNMKLMNNKTVDEISVHLFLTIHNFHKYGQMPFNV